jgi:DNA replication licensing factor MCM4
MTPVGASGCRHSSPLSGTLDSGVHADKHGAGWTGEDSTLKKDREQVVERVSKLARDPNIYHKLVESFAPSIYEMDDVKKGLLCQLFGGSNSGGSSQGAGSGRFRGDLNVLLVGDPGVSKSQLLQYVHKIAPRGIYTSGKGSSAVGLTAYVTKDPETKDIVLESGALVLSDRGICCIDEFDKMSDSTRAILHEAMEQQTISVAKAGIICSLNARTSILAAANPINSRYNPTLSVVENMNLPPTLLSRFDLIYLVLDQPNPVADRRLAKHIVSLYYEHPPQATSTVLSIDEFAEYVSFCAQRVPPEAERRCQECPHRGICQYAKDEHEQKHNLGNPAAARVDCAPLRGQRQDAPVRHSGGDGRGGGDEAAARGNAERCNRSAHG